MSQSVEFLRSQQTLLNLPQPVYRNVQFYQRAVKGALNSGNPEAVKSTSAQYGVYAALSGRAAYPFQLAPEPQSSVNTHVCQLNLY